MNKSKEVKSQHELAVATDFANFLSNFEESYHVIATPDPPDAVLKSDNGNIWWIEITDIFRSEEEAREAYSYAIGGENVYVRPNEIIFEPDTKVSQATIKGIEKKLSKDNYLEIAKKYGKGTLVLYIDDPLFDQKTLSTILSQFHEVDLESEFFKSVYIDYPVENSTARVFVLILGS